MRLTTALTALAVAFFAGAASAADITLQVARTSSTLTGAIALDAPLYLDMRYASDRPLRLQAQAYSDGKPVAAQRMNASALHPAGRGDALAWVSVFEPGAVDAVKVTAYEADWKPVAVFRLPVALAWDAAGRAPPARPAWVDALVAAERRLIAAQAPADDNGGLIGLLIGLIVMAGVPAYLAAQYFVTRTLPGRWRVASFAPLVLMVPLIAHALFALAAGSNLWPLLVILYAPVACAYLVGLYAARAVTRLGGPPLAGRA